MKPESKKIARSVYIRYVLMNIPGLAILFLVLMLIRNWWEIPGWLLGLIFALWVAKDMILFPFVWRSYDPEMQRANTMIGKRGIVKTHLAPYGYIQVGGELWKAKRHTGGPALEPGSPVRVHKMKGLTLYVVPDD
jgi:membrane protein implicated in regulation of membrane protease activity